ncbi:MAG: preprotein translocase subunit YajC, partial [Bacteroidaceae bacterium]|nr:preprotein translocase subunit YajC [Bacteroidaceae bacterium]
RPQSKKQKQIKTFREGLKNGDRVVTAGGIFGRIKEIKDGIVFLEISDNVRIRVDLNSIYPSAEEANTADTQAK